MTSCGADGKTCEMAMAKDSPNFAVKAKRLLLPFEGTDLMIYKRADLIILDDQGGRLVARNNGLLVTGRIGVLIEAKERGFMGISFFHSSLCGPCNST